MSALFIFVIFFAILAAVYLEHYYGVCMAKTFACVACVVTAATFCTVMFFPYASLPSMDAKFEVVTSCLYVLSISLVISMITTGIAARASS